MLQLVGAGSGQVAEATLTVMADPAALTLAEQTADADQLGWPVLAVLAAAVVLALLILSSLATSLVRRSRRRKTAKAAATAEAGPAATPASDADTAVLPVAPPRASVRHREGAGV